ncbi:hypothetical protein PG993_010948 [Apiospora rasikravindrae]|uniref:Uncharacterized protein n=1 Tax=Apiospora rasikravindrae TaxID=990691 RepID=A0ABR1SCU5_9PEZI
MTSTILSSEFHSAGAPAAAASRPQRRIRGGSGGGGAGAGAGLSGQVKNALAAQQQADKGVMASTKSKKAGEERRRSPGAAKSGSSLLEWDAICEFEKPMEEWKQGGQETGSWKDCFWSWTYLHNESGMHQIGPV